MSVWTVALGAALGVIGGVLLLACGLLVMGLVFSLRREPRWVACRVCGLRASHEDLIVHEEMEHHHG